MRVCKIEDCENRHFGIGYCAAHYYRVKTYGTPLGSILKYRHHGMSGTPIHNIWCNMKGRCSNPNKNNYKYYGGRGIRVCDRWNDFLNFLKDMGDRPEGLELDRINTDGDYEPSNCRWVTHKQNAQNRGRNTAV